tara:strand:+ start:99 stop:2438 length:2340 start_codon:yes stop_codon:yes gene_type:complete
MAEQEEFDPFAPKEEFDPFAPRAIAPGQEKLGPMVADMGQDDTLDSADQAPATDADMLQVSNIALEPNLPLGPGGETGLEAYTKRMTGLPMGREAFTMAGAMVGQGAETGVDLLLKRFPGLGKLGAEQLAATAGATVGNFSFETLDALVRYLQNDPEQQLLSVEGAGETLKRGVKEATFEMGAQYAGKALQVFPRAVKAGFRKLFGTDNPRAVELASLAARYKVPFGIGQASQSGFKGITRVLGVIPFVGTPLKEGAKRSETAVAKSLYEMLNAFSPRVSSTLEMSTELVDAAAKKFELFNTTSNALYRRFYNLAQQLPADKQAFIPTTNVREAASKILEMARAGSMNSQGIASSVSDDALRIEKIAAAVEQFPTMITPAFYQRQMQLLQNELATLKGINPDFNIDGGVVLKAAFEKDLNNPVLNFAGKFKNGTQLPSDEIIRKQQLTGEVPIPKEDLATIEEGAITGKMIADSLKKADSYFHKGMLKFESPVAKRLGRVDKNIFRNTWKQLPTKEKDAMFKDIFNLKSRDAIKDLRKLVGAKTLHKSLRSLVDDSVNKSNADLTERLYKDFEPEKALKQEKMTPTANALTNIQKTLNLGTKEGDAVLDEVLKFSGVNSTEFKNVLKLASASADFFIPNASVFLQRRVTLGGLGALATVGGSAKRGPLGMLPIVYIMRMGGKAIMNPKNLKTMTQVADNSLAPRVRRAALARMVQDLNSIAEDKESPPIDENIAQQLLRSGQQAVSTGQEVIGAVPEVIKNIQSNLPPNAMQKIQNAIQ